MKYSISVIKRTIFSKLGDVCFQSHNIEYQKLEFENACVKGVLESIWVKIKLTDGSYKLIGNCYRPNTAPLADPVTAVNLLDGILAEIKNIHKKSKIILTGDFNLDLFKFSTHKPTDDFITNMNEFLWLYSLQQYHTALRYLFI